LIDLADEVAYNAADLDDAFSAGLLTGAQIAESVAGYARILDELEMQFPGASERERFQESLRRVIDLLVTGLIEGTAQAAAQSGRARLWKGAAPTRPGSRRVTPETLAANREVKSVLHDAVYTSEALASERNRSTGMIGELFQFFSSFRNGCRIITGNSPKASPRIGWFCDYIAGMTTGFLSYLRTDAGTAESGHSGCVTTLDNSTGPHDVQLADVTGYLFAYFLGIFVLVVLDFDLQK